METFAYVGSFFAGEDRGIRVFRLDENGALAACGACASQIDNPLYLCTDPRGRVLYAADCLDDWQQGGAISAFAIDAATGVLTPIGRARSEGVIPVNVDVSADGRFLLTANCGPFAPGDEGRTVAVLPLGADGAPGPAVVVHCHTGSSVHEEKQSSPHPHQFLLDPSNRWAVAPDLGADRVFVYRFDAASGAIEPGEPTSVSVAPGTGPRHFRFHPNGRHAWLITEIGGTIVTWDWDPEKGQLSEIDVVSSLPGGTQCDGAAELRIHPNGRFLYASNREDESLAAFSIDEESGQLSLVGHTATEGAFPRSFEIDPSGAFLLVANERSGTVRTLRVEQSTGALTPIGAVTEVPNPACIAFAPIPGA